MKKWLRICKKAIISTEYTLKVYYMHFNIVFVDKKNNLKWDWDFLKSYLKNQNKELNECFNLTDHKIVIKSPDELSPKEFEDVISLLRKGFDGSTCTGQCDICGIQNNCEFSYTTRRNDRLYCVTEKKIVDNTDCVMSSPKHTVELQKWNNELKVREVFIRYFKSEGKLQMNLLDCESIRRCVHFAGEFDVWYDCTKCKSYKPTGIIQKGGFIY